MLQSIVDRSKRIVFFGGAGVSTASGIPDFRSEDGLYQQEFEGLAPEMILSKSFFAFGEGKIWTILSSIEVFIILCYHSVLNFDIKTFEY